MEPQPTMVNPPNNILVEWEAASRPFKQRSREFYRTAASIAFLLIIILFFIREFLLIGVVVAVLFVMYVLSTVPPERLKNRITTLGIDTGGHFHKWEEMNTFWFDARYGQRMLVVHMLVNFPNHLQLMLENAPETEIKKILSERLPFKEKPDRTFLDNAADWLARKIPMEKFS